MTELEKHEIAALVSEAVAQAMAANRHCPLGIRPETAHELISFADTWKTCRKVLISGVIATAVGGLLTALWCGIKTMLHR
ncbi:MAG: hypothetical protein E7041_05990 [Lentisphaerae bacterium]|nr:hypothetical protein [Lentisphaerota bacterium]MBQ9804663.1 hypothetical protein [Lentisphaeria bacterium]